MSAEIKYKENGVMEKFLTVDELAEAFGVPRSWVYSRTRLRGDDQIPHIKCGKYCRFNMAQVIDWLNNKQKMNLE